MFWYDYSRYPRHDERPFNENMEVEFNTRSLQPMLVLRLATVESSRALIVYRLGHPFYRGPIAADMKGNCDLAISKVYLVGGLGDLVNNL